MGIECYTSGDFVVVATEIGLIIKLKQQWQRTNHNCWSKCDQNRNIFYNLIIRNEIPRMQVKKFYEIYGVGINERTSEQAACQNQSWANWKFKSVK